jgi:hypothetical protein
MEISILGSVSAKCEDEKSITRTLTGEHSNIQSSYISAANLSSSGHEVGRELAANMIQY